MLLYEYQQPLLLLLLSIVSLEDLRQFFYVFE